MELTHFIDDYIIPILLDNDIWNIKPSRFIKQEMVFFEGLKTIFYYHEEIQETTQNQDIKEWFTKNVESTQTKREEDLMDETTFWHWFCSTGVTILWSLVIAHFLDRVVTTTTITHQGKKINRIRILYGRMLDAEHPQACGCYTPYYLMTLQSCGCITNGCPLLRKDLISIDANLSYNIFPIEITTRDMRFVMDLSFIRFGKELIHKYPDIFIKSTKHGLPYVLTPENRIDHELWFFPPLDPMSAWEIPLLMEAKSDHVRGIYNRFINKYHIVCLHV